MSSIRTSATENRGGAPVVYEELLDRDLRWALSEGSRHFEENSAVFAALHKITSRLKAIGVSYAVVGGMALFRHGVRRFTEDVDLLVTKGDLKCIHEKLDGLGYLTPFARSRNLRDAELGVRIEFLTTGDFPGDGKPKPVAFPDPRDSSIEEDGVSYISLPKLVELKLASGMTNAGRIRDLADVQELIRVRELPVEFADQLDPFVQDRFRDLWKQARKRYVTTIRKSWPASEPGTTAKMVAALAAVDSRFADLEQDGVVIEDDPGSDRLRLSTTDLKIAEKYGLVDEAEYWEQ